jgi:SpoVK/Ycf46/Vps4 family AAA+-type ATPase
MAFSGILRILLRDENIADDVDIETLAKKTDGFSGSDLKRKSYAIYYSCVLYLIRISDLCVSAALDSVKEHTFLPWASRHAISAPATLPENQLPVVDAPTSALGTTESTTDASESTVKIDSLMSISSSDVAPESMTTKYVDESASSESTASDCVSETIPTTPADESTTPKAPEVPAAPRILRLHNFTQALKEITPSASETLGSLADLRKWNEEFGEGRRDRKKRQVWGKGRFGFVNNHTDISEEGKVAKEQPNL